LLPFDEYLPWRKLVSWPDWLIIRGKDALAGDEEVRFVSRDVPFVVAICWENLFSADVRGRVASDIAFLASTSNEAFTASEVGRKQLYRMNAFRSVENGLPVVRAATTGYSVILDADGSTLAQVVDEHGRPVDGPGYAISNIPARSRETPFRLFGDWIVGACALLLLVVVSLQRVAKPEEDGPCSI
jgi:apolipoprotein N-acyltransferase